MPSSIPGLQAALDASHARWVAEHAVPLSDGARRLVARITAIAAPTTNTPLVMLQASCLTPDEMADLAREDAAFGAHLDAHRHYEDAAQRGWDWMRAEERRRERAAGGDHW